MIMMNEVRSETATPGMKTNAEIWMIIEQPWRSTERGVTMESL